MTSAGLFIAASIFVLWRGAFGLLVAGISVLWRGAFGLFVAAGISVLWRGTFPFGQMLNRLRRRLPNFLWLCTLLSALLFTSSVNSLD